LSTIPKPTIRDFPNWLGVTRYARYATDGIGKTPMNAASG